MVLKSTGRPGNHTQRVVAAMYYNKRNSDVCSSNVKCLVQLGTFQAVAAEVYGFLSSQGYSLLLYLLLITYLLYNLYFITLTYLLVSSLLRVILNLRCTYQARYTVENRHTNSRNFQILGL